MLKEFYRLRQVAEGYRRLFSDDYFDLWIWFDKPHGQLLGFQLVKLDQAGDDKVFTWNIHKGAIFTGVLPEGEGYKKTQFLVLNGRMPKSEILQAFRERSTNLPAEIRVLVDSELQAWPEEEVHDAQPSQSN